VCINPLPSESRLHCCDRCIRCQRSLAVKPLTVSGSPSPCVEWAGLRLRMYRYAAARCVRWQIDVDVRKQQLRVGRRRPLRVHLGLSQRACPSTGAFLNGRRASTAGFRTLQVKPQSREARLWLVVINRPKLSDTRRRAIPLQQSSPLFSFASLRRTNVVLWPFLGLWKIHQFFRWNFALEFDATKRYYEK